MEQKIKDIKEVVNNLEGKKLIKCPYCKEGYQFIRKTYDLVEIYEDEDGLTDEMINPAYKDDVFICKNCNEAVEEFE